LTAVNIIILVDKENQLIVITTENDSDFDDAVEAIIHKLKELGSDNITVSRN